MFQTFLLLPISFAHIFWLSADATIRTDCAYSSMNTTLRSLYFRGILGGAICAIAATILSGCAALRIPEESEDGATVEVPGADGRFTIGTGNRRLMYGYPVPYSTSHFVLSVDGRLASNNPRFPSSVTQLRGDLVVEGTTGSIHTNITFPYDGLEVTQRLIPVDGTFKDVPLGKFGQYYRIEYEIVNKSGRARKVGLMLLIDTMIDDNDAAQMDADGSRVAKQTALEGRNVPGELLVYRVAGNINELTASLVTNRGRAVTPDALYIGKWPYFHSVTWSVAADGATYTDSGILVKWDEKDVPSDATRYVATHYGLPRAGEISALMNSPIGFDRDSANVYFALGKADLTAEGKQAIDDLLQRRNPSGVFIEVYADAKGNEQTNLALSKRRSDNVIAYLRTKDVPAEVIIPKAYGESYALQTEEARTSGRQEDRRATIVILMRR